MDDETLWKEQLHAQWTTSDGVIDQLVRRACGSAVAKRSRIIGGEGNEVWSITTLSGEELILRVSRSNSYAAEQWATEQARRMGVPVPEVLLVDNAVPIPIYGADETGDAADTQVAVWIHRTIRGEPLGSVQDERVARRLTVKAGEFLARIHAVVMSGNGWIEAQGPQARGLLGNFSDYLSWDDRAADSALANGISRTDLNEAGQLLESYRHVWETPPRLLHGDWLPEHVLVRAGPDGADSSAVAGIIDFGNTRSGDPAYDIAYWQFFWDSDLYPTAALIAGYRNAGDPGQFLEHRVHLCRLSLSMRAISYYTEANRPFPAQHAAQRFAEALSSLRSAR